MDWLPLRVARRRERTTVSRARRCAAGLFAVMLYGCAGDGPPPGGGGTAFDQIQTEIFNQNCLAAGCHNAQFQAGGLNLSPGASYDDLVDVLSENAAARSEGLLRVEPFEPDSSFLVIKLTNPSGPQGTRMPQGQNPLSQSDIDMIRSWILDGAPAGGTPIPTVSAAPTSTVTPPPPTASATLAATATGTPTITPTPSITGTATPTVTGSAPPTSTATDTPTVTPTASDSPSPTATATPGLFDQIQTTIFNTTCTELFCHDTVGMSGGLVLVEGESYGDLVNIEPQNFAALERGLLRVEPFDPDNSFLVIKVEGPTPAEGLRMPSNLPPLTPEQILLVRQWIAEGAAQ
jgi:hypothetical protein